MFWYGMGLGVVIGIILTLFGAWYFFLKDFTMFKS